jgi:hypothetical protein
MTAVAPRAWPAGQYCDLTREVFADRASDARSREVILMPPGPKYQYVRHFFRGHFRRPIRVR